VVSFLGQELLEGGPWRAGTTEPDKRVAALQDFEAHGRKLHEHVEWVLHGIGRPWQRRDNARNVGPLLGLGDADNETSFFFEASNARVRDRHCKLPALRIPKANVDHAPAKVAVSELRGISLKRADHAGAVFGGGHVVQDAASYKIPAISVQEERSETWIRLQNLEVRRRAEEHYAIAEAIEDARDGGIPQIQLLLLLRHLPLGLPLFPQRLLGPASAQKREQGEAAQGKNAIAGISGERRAVDMHDHNEWEQRGHKDNPQDA